jgi:predicted dehydrogenase
MISGFPVFDNQPSLKLMEQFILTDLGSHLFDVARFLFGEAQSVYCRVRRVHKDIRGEDVSTTVLQMQSGVTVLVQLAYAGNHLERECFPQTLVFVEGSKGSAEIGPDYVLKVTTSGGTQTTRHVPPHYAWADARYEVVHSSIVPCQQDILKGLRGGDAETTGADNLKTLRLVFASYESAAKNEVVVLES